jgi:glutathione synthase/RimK-type ligase-like ATP-grasp enzyme
VRVALATCAPLAAGAPDDRLLAEALRRRDVSTAFEVWNDPSVDWPGYDLVVIRSTWDYTRRRDDFLAWADALGERLRNPPALVRWNSDKRYLAELEAAGVPVVPTAFAGPDSPEPTLEGELVVKPTISAGARDTGRFGPGSHAAARELLDRLRAAGRTAMVQPYLGAVDEHGETALVFFAGEPSHVLRKRALLEPDREAPLRDDAIGSAEAMWRDDLVEAGQAGAAERSLGQAVLRHLEGRFGTPPLYLRVDLLAGPDGPVVLEVEAVEPALYLSTSAGAADRLAEAIASGG